MWVSDVITLFVFLLISMIASLGSDLYKTAKAFIANHKSKKIDKEHFKQLLIQSDTF